MNYQYKPFGGCHGHGGTPIAGWFIMDNATKRNDLGDTTISGNLQMGKYWGKKKNIGRNVG